MDLDMALGSILSLNNFMALEGSIAHTDPQQQQGLHTLTWSQVANQIHGHEQRH